MKILKIYYIDFTENYIWQCLVSFDHEQHKCNPQMNNTSVINY